MAFEPEALAALTLELVAVPSVTGEEEQLADLVEARCRSFAGAQVERLGNAVVVRCGPPRDHAVALVGHLDTVPPWPGHEASREGLRVIGRGAADMKGGDAAIIAVLEHAARAELPVVGVFYDREEGLAHLNGLGAVLRGSRLLGTPSFAFVGEPTTCTVHAGCVGGVNADITFHGRTGHAARPWEGENAIVRAAGFLTRASAVQSRAVIVDGLEFHDTLTVTTAHGGTARNVVPDSFVLGVNARFSPAGSAAGTRAAIEALVAGDGTIEFLDEAPAARPNLENPTLQAFLAATGVEVRPKQAWTDVATLQANGIPAVNYGPGEPPQAHQPGEWVDGAAVAEVATRLVAFLEAS
ncbi:MAG TPA: succinyl-diaminopimelate desuccinylase [Gaiellales bacterium]|jgi:succinyl-diaminopimelate desuccinylase